MARFEVDTVFLLSSRQQLVLAGQVIEGAVRPGMHALIWLDGGAFWSVRVDAVEIIDRRQTRDTLTGLVCSGQDAEAAALCEGLCPAGTVIEVTEARA